MSHPNYGGPDPDGRHHFRAPQPPHGAVPPPRQPMPHPVPQPQPRQAPPLPPPVVPEVPTAAFPPPPVVPERKRSKLPYVGAGMAACVLLVIGVATTGGGGDEVPLPSGTPTIPTVEQAAAPNAGGGPVGIGTTVDVDGLNITVQKVLTRGEFGKRLSCVEVTYVNASEDYADRSPSDWTVRNPKGASSNSYIYTEDDALDSGEIEPGGSDEGIVCFDVPRRDMAAVEYKSNMFNDGPDAEWSVS